MLNRLLTIVILGSSLAVSGSAGAFAQQEQTHPAVQVSSDKAMHDMSGSCPMMSQMKLQHEEMSGIVNRLDADMKGIVAEKDPTALTQKLAAHQVLIDKLQSLIASMGHCDMMKGMSCDMPMMDKTTTTPKSTP
jgi:hypothetical protein